LGQSRCTTCSPIPRASSEARDRAPASSYDVFALADTETGFAPGEHRHYSNVGYRTVGVALEAVTGEPYGELV
jgi:CubicO group peptidase (beta-lactamase class C family)